MSSLARHAGHVLPSSRTHRLLREGPAHSEQSNIWASTSGQLRQARTRNPEVGYDAITSRFRVRAKTRAPE
jgi:hypothetical protein